MGDSVTLLIGILIAALLPVVLVVVALTIAALGGRRQQGPAGPPPGWYADPHGDGAMRWWDGRRWTSSTYP